MNEEIKTIIRRHVEGQVLYFNKKKGFGFLEPYGDDKRDILLHKKYLPEDIFIYMIKKQRVIYDYIEDDNGIHAENVKVIMDENTIIPLELRPVEEVDESSEDKVVEDDEEENIASFDFDDEDD